MKDKFWESTALENMTEEQWEALCDGCGKCCVHKLEDDDGKLYQTDVSCEYFNRDTCRCTDYQNRQKLVPDCIQVTPEGARSYNWLPNTCAYKLLAKGKPLPEWHPLISGDPDSVHKANRSARKKTISERNAGDLEDHIIALLLPDDSESDPLSEILID